jgi:hypothetical protein
LGSLQRWRLPWRSSPSGGRTVGEQGPLGAARAEQNIIAAARGRAASARPHTA